MSDKTPVDKKPEGISYLTILVILALGFLFLTVGLPFAFAFTYVLLGINSIGYYGPPIGEVMAFVARASTLLANATVPLFAFLAFLAGISKRFRKRIEDFFDRL